MTTSEDFLSLFGLHVGDMLLSNNNSMRLYKDDNSVPYGEIMFTNGNVSIRCGFGTFHPRTSMIKRSPHGVSFIPVYQSNNHQ